MTTSAIDTFNNLGLATTSNTASASTKKQTLGQDQFLKLLTTQLTHQDPMKPMENGEFLGQMAQFSTVSGIQELQASFKDFASSINSNQALQAVGLVGHYVSAPSKQALLRAGDAVFGDFDLPSSSNQVQVKIINNKTGETVRDIDLGSCAKGKVDFAWDGKDNSGVAMSPGIYKVEASALVDGKNTVLATNIQSQVQSVVMGSSGLQVNLVGLDPVKFSQIKQIL